MNLKKITSLTMLTSILVMSYTGIMLFVSPPGRIANWAEWQLFGLTKEQYGEIHTTFMVLFLAATVLHVYYNWKPMTSYMKNRAKELIVFTNDMIAALAITLLFLLGTLYQVTPFSDFIEFGVDVSDSWIETYGEPPYGHAELSSLKLFAKKMGLELAASEAALKERGIQYESADQTLKDIGVANGISPEAIYQIMQSASGDESVIREPVEEEKYTGLGRRKIADVARIVGLETEELIAKLATIGINTTEEERFKDVSENAGMSPSDIIDKLGL